MDFLLCEGTLPDALQSVGRINRLFCSIVIVTRTQMSSDHWSFYQLPPFFTLQPAPVARDRQVNLWTSLILDHASDSAARTPNLHSVLLRFYNTDSDIFNNAKIGRRLSPEAARVVLEALVAQHPNDAVVVTEDENFAVLVATTEGGIREIEQSLLSWILEMGQGTTTAMLAKQGAVMTFDELAEGKCLQYNVGIPRYRPRSSQDAVLASSNIGLLSEEQAARTFLQVLTHRPVSVMKPFKITLFNLDGSSKQPYEGVKFGGE